MLDTNARKHVQKTIDSICIHTHLTTLHPNIITILAFIIGIVSAIMIAMNQLYIAFTLLWISGLFDVLDGSVARLTNTSSKFGAFLDLVFDRMVEASIILGFYFLQPQHAFFYLLFFISVLFNFSTFLVAANLYVNTGIKSMHYDVGLMERSESFIAFSLMLLFPIYQWIILFVFTILIFLTGIIRTLRLYIVSKRYHHV